MWSTASFFARMSLTSTNLVNRSTISEKPVYPFGDGGNLVTSSQWMEWLKSKGIRQELSAPHSQYQNGFVERHVQMLRNMTATALHSSGLPKSYWAEALLWARYAWNCIPRWDNENLSPYKPLQVGMLKYLNYTHSDVGCSQNRWKIRVQNLIWKQKILFSWIMTLGLRDSVSNAESQIRCWWGCNVI